MKTRESVKEITDNDYWSDHWKSFSFDSNFKQHPLNIWLDKNIPDTAVAKAFEVGCFPGKFLALLGEKGYELNGIDSASGLDSMGGWLRENNYNVGKFICGDFNKFQSEIKYNLVCSFGFIEHFDNWETVLSKHLELTKKGGLCIISVPNLSSPLYYLLYRMFEKRVLINHNPDAMSKKKIMSWLRKSGVEVIKDDYIGGFYFRFVAKRGRRYRITEKIVNSFSYLFNVFPRSISSRRFGIIIRKS